MKKPLFSCFSIMLLVGLYFTGIAQKQASPVFNHLALFVTDLNSSASFYRDVVGLHTIPEPFKDGKHAWFKVGPVGALHIIEGAAKKSEYNRNAHLCFSVPSVENFIKVLNKANVSYEDKDGKLNTITRRVDGVNQIYFKDPDNYWIEINDAKL